MRLTGLQNWSDLEKRNVTSLLETELQFLCHPACSLVIMPTEIPYVTVPEHTQLLQYAFILCSKCKGKETEHASILPYLPCQSLLNFCLYPLLYSHSKMLMVCVKRIRQDLYLVDHISPFLLLSSLLVKIIFKTLDICKVQLTL